MVLVLYLILNIIDQNIITDFCNYTLSNKYTLKLLKIFLISIFIICLTVILFVSKIEKLLKFEFFYIISLSFLGMILLISANDLIIMFLSLELQTFGLYLLLAIQQKR